MNLDGQDIGPGQQIRRTDRKLVEHAFGGRPGGQGQVVDGSALDVGTSHFLPVEIDHRSVVFQQPQRQLGKLARVVHFELVAEVVGDVFIGGIASVIEQRDFIAVAIAQLRRSLGPGGVVELRIVPGPIPGDTALVGSVVEIFPCRTGPHQRGAAGLGGELFGGRRRGAVGQSRIGAVGRVIDRPHRVGVGQHQRETGLDESAVLVHLGRVERRVESDIAPLLEDVIGTLGEVCVYGPVDLVQPVVAGAGRVHVLEAAITPASRFADDGPVDDVGQIGEAGLVGLDAQRSVVEHVLVNAVGKFLPELFDIQQGQVDLAGTGGPVVAVVIDAIRAEVFQAGFGVPAMEVPLRPVEATPRGIPVVLRPIPIAGELVGDQVVDEVGNIEHALDGLVVQRLLAHHREEAVPGVQVSVLQLPRADGIILLLVPAVVAGGKGGVGPLDRIVNAPVDPVEIHMKPGAMMREAAHGDLAVGDPLVVEIRDGGWPPIGRPGVDDPGPQHDRVEPVDRIIAEQGIFQFRRAVIPLEHQPQPVLQCTRRRPATGPAVDPQTRIALKQRIPVAVEQLGRGGPLEK